MCNGLCDVCNGLCLGTRNMYDNSRGGVYDRNRDVDQVPIHTVQAADTARLIHTVPKLNLQQVDNR